MELFFYITAFVMGLYVLLILIYTIVVIRSTQKPRYSKDKKISILVAARNEEENILDCLRALGALDYPPELMEVLIGDDDSGDGTAAFIVDFIMDKRNFFYHRIDHQYPGIYGKQNVLANLAHKAKGDYFLVTDADILVGPKWAAGLAGAFDNAEKMNSGPTIVEGRGFLSKMQSLDWILGFGIAKALEGLGLPITAVGNNMGITREAYFGVGGYEGIGFSVVEDYKLFKEVIEKPKEKFSLEFHPGVLNISKPIKGLKQMMRQRKRWFRGGTELAWYNKIPLAFNAMVAPLLIASLFLLPLKANLVFFGLKMLADLFIISVTCVILKKLKFLVWFFPFECYYFFMAIAITIDQMIPGKVIWKGRKY